LSADFTASFESEVVSVVVGVLLLATGGIGSVGGCVGGRVGSIVAIRMPSKSTKKKNANKKKD
jgi:hypothetical protein